MRIRRPLEAQSLATLVAVAASFSVPSTIPQATAQIVGLMSAPEQPIALHVAEASRRFGIPEAWIYAVMRAESGGDPAALSEKGAIGLMQVMPATYAELRARYGFGSDPGAVRDNILAGTAFLREMYDRFGAPGFLAAYNAGPGRYEEYLIGRPLPLETRAYVAQLEPLIGGGAQGRTAVTPDPLAWTRASLFAGRRNNAGPAPDPATPPPPSFAEFSSDSKLQAVSLQDMASLFVPVSGNQR